MAPRVFIGGLALLAFLNGRASATGLAEREISPPTVFAGTALVALQAEPQGDRLVLRSASELGPRGRGSAPSVVTKGAAHRAGSAPSAGREPWLPLRLQTSLNGALSPAEGSVKYRLPVGELNQGSWVRATRVQMRDGAMFAVGSADAHTFAAAFEAPHAATDRR